jgi:hypothetical protein
LRLVSSGGVASRTVPDGFDVPVDRVPVDFDELALLPDDFVAEARADGFDRFDELLFLDDPQLDMALTPYQHGVTASRYPTSLPADLARGGCRPNPRGPVGTALHDTEVRVSRSR